MTLLTDQLRSLIAQHGLDGVIDALPMAIRRIDEAEETKRGEALIDILYLRPIRSGPDYGRVPTTWGTKTPIGLFRTVKRIIEGK